MPEVESASWLGAAKARSPKISELDSAIFVGKAEAAKLLKVHPRQLERRAQQGSIEKRFLPRKAGEKSARVVYSRADIEALLDRGAGVIELDPSELAITWVSKAEAAKTLGISPGQLAKKHRDGYIEQRTSPNGVAEYSMADVLALKSGKPIRVAPPAVLKAPAWEGGPLDPQEWIPKSAAAKLLGVSLRQVERREQNGYIEKRIEPRLAHESMGRVLYSRSDVIALKSGKPNIHAREVPISESQPGGEKSAGAGRALAVVARKADPFAGLPAFLAQLGAAYPAPAAPRLWLTLEEAAEHSGLPASWLKRRAEDGSIDALNVGTAKACRWRFNRDALGKITA
jgi:hypothetical protein